MELAKNLGKVPAHDLVNDLVKEANSDQKNIENCYSIINLLKKS